MQRIKTIFRIWLPFVVAISAFCALGYTSVQQAYRQGANDPQIQMAEDAVATLANGGSADAVVPVNQVPVDQSLTPFLIVYDAKGIVLASSATLDGQTPDLPDGVLDSAKQMGEDRITWQPRDGVRIAAVIVPYQNGFVLAGRSLREVESRVDQLTTFTGLAWLLALAATLAVIAFGEFFLAEKK